MIGVRCGECGGAIRPRREKGLWYASAPHPKGRACEGVCGWGNSLDDALRDYSATDRHRLHGCGECDVVSGCDCAHCAFGHHCKERKDV